MNELHVQARIQRKDFELDVDQRIPAKGLTAIFGASGSGKTTLLRCCAGLERSTLGSIWFDGECWQDEARRIFVPAYKRSCGYVFQDARLLPHLSVRGNLRYGLSRTPAKDRRFDFDKTVELLGVGNLLDRHTDGLSGGERQRVALARALLASPRLLLMDEPLASLDAGRRGEILYYIERLRDEVGVPILYVSHEIEEVVRLADHMVLLSDGKVAAAGPVQELMGRIELRRLIGRYEGGAVIEVKVASQDLKSGLARLAFAGGELLVPDVEALVGGTLRVRVRARDVSIAIEEPRGVSMLNCLRGRVAEMGTEPGTSIDVRIDVSGTPLLARITRHSAERLQLAPGREVWAMVKAVSLDRHSVGYA